MALYNCNVGDKALEYGHVCLEYRRRAATTTLSLSSSNLLANYEVKQQAHFKRMVSFTVL